MDQFSFNVVIISSWFCWILDELDILSWDWFFIELSCTDEFEVDMAFVLEIDSLSWFSREVRSIWFLLRYGRKTRPRLWSCIILLDLWLLWWYFDWGSVQLFHVDFAFLLLNNVAAFWHHLNNTTFFRWLRNFDLHRSYLFFIKDSFWSCLSFLWYLRNKLVQLTWLRFFNNFGSCFNFILTFNRFSL